MEEQFAFFGGERVEIDVGEGWAVDARKDGEAVGDVAESAFFHEEQGPGGGDVACDESPGLDPGAAGARAAADLVEVAIPVPLEGTFDDDGDGSVAEGDVSGPDVAGGTAFEGFESIGQEIVEKFWEGGLPMVAGDGELAGRGPAAGERSLFEEIAGEASGIESAEGAIVGGGALDEFAPLTRGDGVAAGHVSAGAEFVPAAEEIGACGGSADAVGEEEEIGRLHSVGAKRVGVEEKDVAVVEKHVAQVQIGVAEPGFLEGEDQLADTAGEFAMIGGRLAVEEKLVEMGVERDGGFDGFGDDGVAELAGEMEADEDGDGVWAVDGGFLELLEVEELAESGVAGDEAFESLAAAWVELEVVVFAVEGEAPDLAVAAVFDQGSDVGKVLQCGLKSLGIGHKGVYKGMRGVCLEE